MRGDSKVESNDSPEIPDKGETSDIPGLKKHYIWREKKRLHASVEENREYKQQQ